MQEERLERIESKVALLDDMVDGLNTTVYQQQKQIAHLQAMIDSLAAHLRELKETLGDRPPANDRPPHY